MHIIQQVQRQPRIVNKWCPWQQKEEVEFYRKSKDKLVDVGLMLVIKAQEIP